MKTTLNLHDDVIDKAKAVAVKFHVSFHRVVNETLR
jgi:hypothetical protein